MEFLSTAPAESLCSHFFTRIAEESIISVHPRFEERSREKSIYLSAWDEKASSVTSKWRRSTCVARGGGRDGRRGVGKMVRPSANSVSCGNNIPQLT